MSDDGAQMQAAAVGNAMRGEKEYDAIQYALTGDSELDAISGMLAVLNHVGLRSGSCCNVLSYLFHRYERMEKTEIKQAEERARSYAEMQQMARGHIAKNPSPLSAEGGYTSGGFPVAGGTAALGSLLANVPPDQRTVELVMTETMLKEFEKDLKSYATPAHRST